MSWSDYDYLAEGVGKVRDGVRQRILKLEAELDAEIDPDDLGVALLAPDSGFPPQIVALYAIDEGPLAKADYEEASVADRLAAAREAAAAIAALSDGSMDARQRLLLVATLETANHAEESNNDPELDPGANAPGGPR